ncbi:cytochrome P450 [soil metagenome]
MQQAATYTNAAVWELAQTYGDLSVFGFGPIRFHWLVGPEALRFVLLEQPESFTLGGAYGFLRTIGGDTALITSDEPEHLSRRRLVQPAFHGKRVQGWTSHLQTRNAAFLASLARGETLDFYAAVRPHVLESITEILLGAETLTRHPKLLNNVAAMMDFANSPFLAQQFKIPVPGLPWSHFLRARASADRSLYQEITRRKSAGETSDDVLGMLLETRDETGDALSDTELRDQAVSLVSAGFDTTSAALSWAVYLLLEHREVLNDLREELAGFATLQECLRSPLLERVVKETLRIYPAAPAGLRQVREDVVYKNILIPAGSLVAYSIYVTQRQEASFADALLFKPERWRGGFTPEPFTYLPFGYGARYCIGASLATLIIKLLLVELVTGYGLEAAWRSPVAETGNTVQPKGGLKLRLTPR